MDRLPRLAAAALLAVAAACGDDPLPAAPGALASPARARSPPAARRRSAGPATRARRWSPPSPVNPDHLVAAWQVWWNLATPAVTASGALARATAAP